MRHMYIQGMDQEQLIKPLLWKENVYAHAVRN